MWARVKAAAETALLSMPFKTGCRFRLGYVQPMNGVKASSPGTRVMYAALAPFYPVWRSFFPRYVTTTEVVGRAMLRVARAGAPKHVVENVDISALGGADVP